MKIKLLLILAALSLTHLFSTVSKAQNSDINYGGSRQFVITKNDFAVKILIYNTKTQDELAEGDVTLPPLDSYTVTNLIPGKRYTITVTLPEVDSPGAGVEVANKETGNRTLYTTSYSETITARGKTHGPIEVSLNGATPTSFLFNSTVVTYKIAVTPIDPAEGDGTFISAPNFELTDGTPFKALNDPTVYVLENGQKRAFPSIYHYDSWFFGKRSNIIPVSTHVINSYPTGTDMPFKDGTLLAYSDRPSDKTVFLIHHGSRRPFTSWNTFLALGYQPANITRLPSSVVDSLMRGLDFNPKVVASSVDATLAFVADTSTTYSPSTPSARESVNLKTTIATKIGAANDALLDIEVYDAGGQRVFQKVFEHEYFTTTVESLNYLAAWTPTDAGQYKVKLGIFNGNWTTNYLWNDNAATITVGSPAPPTATPTPTPTTTLSFLASAAVQTNPAVVSQPVNITVSALSNSSISASSVHVDLEIYNAAGQRAFQQVYDNLSFAPSQQISLPAASWIPAATGQYTIKIGIFSSDWAMTHYWLDNAGTINVNAAPTAMSPNAVLTMSGGNSSGGNNQTLVYLVPVGGSIGFSFNGAGSTAGNGSITRYEWRISNTVVSSSQNFSYTLGHGTHNISLAVTNSSGLTDTASARIVINEVPAVTTLLPTSPVFSSQDQNITVNGSGFQQYLTVDIVFPNGNSTTLSGTQILNVSENSFTLRATLGTPGNWKIRVMNPDGGQSGWFNFTVR
jgi:hypothetical protein